MNDQPRKLPKSVRIYILLVYLVLPALGVIAFWCLLLLRWLAGIDAIAWFRDKEPSSVEFFAWLATGATVVVSLWAFFGRRRHLALAVRGVEITGKVYSVGPFGACGQVPVYYEYAFGGRWYFGATDMTKDEAAGYLDSPDIQVVVDPKKPSRSLPHEEVWLKHDS